MTIIDEAIDALRKGKPVLIFDSTSREQEVDMVFHAGSIDYEKIYICFVLMLVA